MKTQRGITISSLIVYVAAMSIIVGIIAVVLSFYNKNVSGMNETGDVNLELSKFTTKMIQETQKPGNDVTNLTETTITFKSGNTYIFQDNRIYQNNIEITNNVKEFQAKLETEGDKKLIKIYILLKKGQAEVVKNLSYVVTETQDMGGVSGVYPGVIQQESPELITKATDIQMETTKFIDATEKNTVVVPGGFKVRTDIATTVQQGIVIEDKNGNQFVWIPIDKVIKDDGTEIEIELGRYTFNYPTGQPLLEQSADDFEDIVTINGCQELPTFREASYASYNDAGKDLNATAYDLEAFITQTKANKGYYIARYEASYGGGNSVDDYIALFKPSTNYTYHRI